VKLSPQSLAAPAPGVLPPSSAPRKGPIVATAAMVVIVAMANYLTQWEINQWLTYGTPVIALTFLVNELTNQFYGARVARRVVLVGFCMALVASAILAPLRIACASATAFLVSQLMDIAIFSRLRRGSWWLAPFASSLSASVLDTVVFFGLAFVGTDHNWVPLAAGDFTTKLVVDLAMLAPFRMAIRSRAARAAAAATV
jgi:uncharacterized PurR-regulated membrane protein YhhQ (DUF165 family)